MAENMRTRRIGKLQRPPAISPSPIHGMYRDIISNEYGQVIEDREWGSNRIVQNCHTLLAALLKRDRGISGLLFCAIGEGLSGWDSRIPSPNVTDTQLVREMSRKTIPPEQIIYLDEANEPTQTPSPQLDIRCTFNGDDLTGNSVQPLREFGLFGGDATEAANSGYMIDRVIHPRIDLRPGMTLTRHIRLTFANNGIRQAGLSGFGATLPVIAIDGIGETYARALANANIRQLSDLVAINPLTTIGNIPLVKLREFRAKARLATSIPIELNSLTPLAHQTISLILRTRPEDLSDSLNIPPDIIVALQENFALLQVALDDELLQQLTLSEVIST